MTDAAIAATPATTGSTAASVFAYVDVQTNVSPGCGAPGVRSLRRRSSAERLSRIPAADEQDDRNRRERHDHQQQGEPALERGGPTAEQHRRDEHRRRGRLRRALVPTACSRAGARAPTSRPATRRRSRRTTPSRGARHRGRACASGGRPRTAPAARRARRAARSFLASVLNSTRPHPSVSNACRRSRYLASTFAPVPQVDGFIHVLPISSRRCSGARLM